MLSIIIAQPSITAFKELSPNTGAHFLLTVYKPRAGKTLIHMPAPQKVVQQLPSQKPQIPVTSGQTPDATSTLISPSITFFVVFTEDVHRPVALPHPQIGRFAPPVPQLSLDLSNCLVGRPLPRRAMDPVHHRLAVSSDFHLDPFAPSWYVKNRGIQFPCLFFAGYSLWPSPATSKAALPFSEWL